MIRKNWLLLAGFFISTGIIISIYLFLWGPLFPLSPIIIGFDQKEFAGATIYYHQGTDISKLINVNIDKLIKETEDFHQLKFQKKVEIIICNSDNELARLTGGCKSLFVTTPVYGRIFISSKAKNEIKEKKINYLVYLKHELSHSLLFQNMSLYRSQYYPGWLMEGIAVYSSNQMGVDGYYTKEETFVKIKEGYFLNPEDWGTTLLKRQGLNVINFPLANKYRFIYSEFACIVDDLIQKYGKEKFNQFFIALLKNGHDNQIFQQIYGIEFNNYLDDFRNECRVSKGGPPHT